jgi:hypothetical protein
LVSRSVAIRLSKGGNVKILARVGVPSALVALIAVMLASFAASTGARAAVSGEVCKTFSASGLKVQWSAIGNVTCAKAKPWLTRLLADRGKPGVKVALKNAPRGFKCAATDDSKGRPFAGACYTGTLAFPKNGFQWFG